MNIFDIVTPLNINIPHPCSNVAINTKNLKRLIERLNPKIIIEVGSWIGGSAIYMAKLLAEDSFLIAVDHFQNSPEMQPEPLQYLKFLSNVKNNNLSHKIIPVAMKSEPAALAIQVQAEMIYIDGAHDYESVYQDLTLWYPKLAPGGVICGDDWYHPFIRDHYEVKQAVERFAQEKNLTVQVDGNIFWWLE